MFADIEPETFNLDPLAVSEVLQRHPRVKAMIPVHLYGAPAEMDPLLELCRRHGAICIEDAAQAIGAEYHGRRAGSLGELACFSFYPTKNLGAAGDGGLLTTNSDELAGRLRSLRMHGSERRYFHRQVGINSRLDAVQAAILNVKFAYLDAWTAGRERNAEIYRKHLSQQNLPVTLPRPAASTTRHVYNQFVILCDRRDELQAWLKQSGIGTEIYYPLPLHLQECFAYLGYRQGDFPVSEAAAARSLALPIYAELSEEEIVSVCDAIREFYGAI